ncbi:MAG: CRP/FNR family cyclic AMP-dependent transcriptional regulator [Chlamydiales bacterium]|jgi:CRP/FNR family cyclic AMP-dependent transcriptional regulator
MKQLTLLEKALLLKKTEIFKNLDLDLLLPISDKTQVTTIEKGEIIFHLNQDAHLMYVIIEGVIEARDQEGHILGNLREGDIFGDESIFSEETRQYETLCRSDVHLLTLSKTNLLSIISECPSVAVGLLQCYASVMVFRPR